MERPGLIVLPGALPEQGLQVSGHPHSPVLLLLLPGEGVRGQFHAPCHGVGVAGPKCPDQRPKCSSSLWFINKGKWIISRTSH